MAEDKIAKNLLLEHCCANCGACYGETKCGGQTLDHTCEHWKKMSHSAEILKDAYAWLQHQKELEVRKEKYAEMTRDEYLKKAADICGREFSQ
jgi:hypothetical protein